MGRPDTWTDDEIKMLKQNILPPGRRIGNARMKASRLGISFRPSNPANPWTEAEEKILRDGGIPEGRSRSSCQQKAAKLGIKFSVKPKGGTLWARWTDEEIAMAQAGIVPPGRTLGATRAYSFQHRSSFRRADPKLHVWTEEEERMVDEGHVPPGRTLSAVKARCYNNRTPFRPAEERDRPKCDYKGRAEAMWVLHNHGFSMRNIGEWFGITGERVRQVLDTYTAWRERHGLDTK